MGQVCLLVSSTWTLCLASLGAMSKRIINQFKGEPEYPCISTSYSDHSMDTEKSLRGLQPTVPTPEGAAPFEVV